MNGICFRKYGRSFLIVVAVAVSVGVLASFRPMFFDTEEASWDAWAESSPGAFSQDDLEIDIVASGEQLDSAEQNLLESKLEEDFEDINVIDEPDNGEQDFSDVPEKMEKETKSQSFPYLPTPTKKSDSKELRIGFVTDPHVESSGIGKTRILDKKFRDRLNYFVERMNNVFGADLLVANGDIIEGTKRTAEIGMEELSLVKKIFARTSIPAYWVLGNHDLRAVTKEQWKSALGINYEYKAFDAKEYRVFILDSNFTSDDKDVAPGSSFTRGKVSQEQAEWLEGELRGTKKKPIVFMHHPPLRNIDAKINEGLLKNASELRRIFSENRVFAVFSGHIEDLYHEEVDGVSYFSLPGLVKHPEYQGSFAEVSLDGDDIEVDVSYLNDDGTYRTMRMKRR